jgi:5-methylcytosine-specific restriction endonuclease McrA
MALATLKPRLATSKTHAVPVLDRKAGATEMERGSAWMAKRDRVAQRYGLRCAACGLVLMKGKWECDHIVPREQGGSNDESNLQPLCTDPCHKAKTAQEAGGRAMNASRYQ